MPPTDLDARYGRTRRSRTRSRVLAVAAAAATLVVVVVWVLWAGLDGSAPTIDARDTGHTVQGPDSVEIDFELTAAPGTAAVCTVQALDEDFTVVGWKVVEVAASDERVRGITVTLRTAQPATTGLVDRCWTR